MLVSPAIRLVTLLVGAALLPLACSVKPEFFNDLTGGSGGGGGGGATGGGSEAGAPCAAATDCPGTDSACFKRACVEGKCAPELATRGTAVPTQKLGDCQQTVCDGFGKEMSKADDFDIPDDGNDCTVDACTVGMLSNSPVPDGQQCGMNQTFQCKGGVCTGCMSDADCGSPGRCFTWVCSSPEATCNKIPAADESSCGACQRCQQGGCLNCGALCVGDICPL
jgi:hypothetical protein